MIPFSTPHSTVVNWHLLEPCNYACNYCYATWSKPNRPSGCDKLAGQGLSEIYKDHQRSKDLLTELSKLKNELGSIRLSFAGGEPLLDKKINSKISFAHSLGFIVSIITNGSLLKRRLNDDSVKKLSMIGVSIDSFNHQTLERIGRVSKDKQPADYTSIIELLQSYKLINPKLKIKINTVVNANNYHEDLSEQMIAIQPDKWKVMRVLPAVKRARAQAITNKQFEQFRATHQYLPFAQFENNEDMRQSYVMIDPYGRFFFNEADFGDDYSYSDPIVEVGALKAFSQVKFDRQAFEDRYKSINSLKLINFYKKLASYLGKASFGPGILKRELTDH